MRLGDGDDTRGTQLVLNCWLPGRERFAPWLNRLKKNRRLAQLLEPLRMPVFLSLRKETPSTTYRAANTYEINNLVVAGGVSARCDQPIENPCTFLFLVPFGLFYIVQHASHNIRPTLPVRHQFPRIPPFSQNHAGLLRFLRLRAAIVHVHPWRVPASGVH